MERFTRFDFGLTALAGAFHQDWGYVGTAGGVVRSHLSIGDEPSAPQDVRQAAAALAQDVSVLLRSPLDDGAIELMWSAATDGNYRFAAGETGRTLLRSLGTACQQWQREHGSAPVDACARWAAPDLAARVAEAAEEMSFPADHRSVGVRTSETPALRGALAACARSVSADLALRLVLRITAAALLPVNRRSWARYEQLAADLSYGEELLSEVEFLVQP